MGGAGAIQPRVLTRAWRLVNEGPAAAAHKMDPEPVDDEALLAVWHANLGGPCDEHNVFDRYHTHKFTRVPVPELRLARYR